MGEVFSVVEAGLAGPASTAYDSSDPGSNSIASELTQ
jgi:hypothetical protein